jgi:hypothetical protein
MRSLAVAGVLLTVSCGTASSSPASPSASIVRTMALGFSGGLTGSLTQINVPSRPSEGSPVCAGTISNDAAGANYLLVGNVGTDEASLSFVVHRSQAAGGYSIGPYPDGTATAPAAVNVVILREGIASWSSGSTGTLVVDPGGRSGTLTADLPFAGWRRTPARDAPDPPTTVLPALHLQGSWVCPAGS